jgi:hypothetical protein
MKTCTNCKIEFPKTKDYFFVKIIKQQNKSGLAIYNSFRSICKKCHGKKGEENRIKKRCLEMDCNISKYRENWKKQYSKTRIKYDLINFKTKSKYHSKELTDYYIANRFRLKMKEIPKEMIQTKRLIIQLKRELKTIKN